MRNIKINCKICKSDNVTLVYDGLMRSGGVGSEYVDDYDVYTCKNCDATFLNPFPTNLHYYYKTREYWESRNINIKKIRERSDEESVLWLSKIGSNKFRDKVVVDVGCGFGGFLDHIKSISDTSIGIEPSDYFYEFLKKKDYQHFKDISKIKKKSADIAVCFDVLEHIKKPKIFIKEIHRILKSGGLIYLGVPNREDFLKSIIPTYLPHFYHTSHLWYFSSRRIHSLLSKFGFSSVKIQGLHKYDLMNMVIWARDGIASGVSEKYLFDKYTEETFSLQLERQLISSHLLASAIKE